MLSSVCHCFAADLVNNQLSFGCRLNISVNRQDDLQSGFRLEVARKQRERLLAKRAGGHPASGERVLQRGQQRHRRERARRHVEHETQKHAGTPAI